MPFGAFFKEKSLMEGAISVAWFYFFAGMLLLLWLASRPRYPGIKMPSLYIWEQIWQEKQYRPQRRWSFAWMGLVWLAIYFLLWLSWYNTWWFGEHAIDHPRDMLVENSLTGHHVAPPGTVANPRPGSHVSPVFKQPVRLWVSPLAPSCLQKLPQFIPGLMQSRYEECHFALMPLWKQDHKISMPERAETNSTMPNYSNIPLAESTMSPVAYLLLSRASQYVSQDFVTGSMLTNPQTLTAASPIMASAYPELWRISTAYPAVALPQDSRPLLVTSQGVVMAYGTDWLYLGFDPVQTKWPRLPSFPVFWQNLWNELAPHRPMVFFHKKNGETQTSTNPSNTSNTEPAPTTGKKTTHTQPRRSLYSQQSRYWLNGIIILVLGLLWWWEGKKSKKILACVKARLVK